MRRRPLLAAVIVGSGLLASSAALIMPHQVVRAQNAAAPATPDTSALINEALDKPVNLEIDTTLPLAMDGIADKSGVRIVAARDVYELLPWGEQTNVQATLKNQSLRDALDAVARKLGLEVVLRAEAVELRPMPALTRLGRRATMQELQALDLLTSHPVGLTEAQPTVRQVVDAVDRKLEELKSPFAVEFRPGTAVSPRAAVAVPRNATLAEALESLAKDTAGTWYPWGKSVVVVPKEVQVRNQLDRRITIRYNGVDISQVLAELEQLSGVDFSTEPGAVQRVPEEYRTANLVFDDTTIRDALESISGFTGLGYVVNAKGVYIWNQNASPGGAAAGGGPGGQQERAVGMIQLDNGMQIFVRPSDLDPDMREYFEHRLKRELGKIREMMKEEGFKPTPPAPPKPKEDAKPAPAEKGEEAKDL